MIDRLSIDHFDAIAGRYAASTKTLEPLYEAVRADLNGLIAGRDLLDVGNGGIFPYDRSRAASVAVLDLSPKMLERVPEGVRRILADARDMAPCADASFDVVLFNLSLHHVAGRTAEETESGIARALAEAWRVLRPGGDLLVYEPVLSAPLYAAARALFRPARTALSLLGVPMVFLQSREALRRRIERATGSPVERREAPATGWSDPLGGTFPGLVMVPVALYPTRFALFRAAKHG